jgi:hypothetical protein
LNKYIIIIGIVVLLLPAELSGCMEYTGQMVTIEGDVDKIEIINYSIITQKRVSWTLQYEKVNDGFVYGNDVERYLIEGIAKNIAGETIDIVNITAKFYDVNDIYLNSKTASKSCLPDKYTWDFSINYTNSEKCFDSVNHVIFEISTFKFT